jgi:hypothetical protein
MNRRELRRGPEADHITAVDGGRHSPKPEETI